MNNGRSMFLEKLISVIFEINELRSTKLTPIEIAIDFLCNDEKMEKVCFAV